MILTFVHPHISIKELPTAELPAFTLITGLNGSGKSHLLQALANGKIHADIAPNHSTDARIFTWSEMVPQDSGGFSGGQLAQERDQLFQQFSGVKSQYEEYVRQPARQAGVSGQRLNNLQALAALSVKDLIDLGHVNDFAQQIHHALLKAVQAASEQILQNLRGNQQVIDDLQNIAAIAGKPLVLLNQDDFRPAKAPSWGKSQPFQQHFGKLFCQYAELQKANALKQHFGESCLDDEAFAAKYMMPPWDFVNETLQTAGLDFEINQPDRTENTVFTPRLRKLTTGDEIQFGSLSSGEKVIMSFALCMYYASEGRQLTTYPKLLLLDEIDAPLHPSMAKHFLTTIIEVLVGKLGVNVIATTHSPSTVALAPDNAIHVMRVGNPGVHKTTKSEALNLLTAGVPTIAIDYAGRRQVFVESPRDAEMHSELFQILKDSGRIISQRSLEFLSTGSTNPQNGVDYNTGSSNVKLIVSSLAKSGNKSVFGFIDWDLDNGDDGRVFTLSKGERYSLENFAFDPLAVLALIAKDPRKNDAANSLGLPGTFTEFVRANHIEYQQAVDKVVIAILPNENHLKKLKIEYLGGATLCISQTYLHMNGHALQEKVFSTYPAFRKYLKNSPVVEMVQEVFREIPAIVPMCMVNSYNRVLKFESH